MFDMLALAFQTDSTRVATLLISREGSNRSFADIGISAGHHDLSHHKNSAEIIEKVKLIDRWYVQQFARFLEKLQSHRRRRRQIAAAQLDDPLRVAATPTATATRMTTCRSCSPAAAAAHSSPGVT